MPGTAFDLSPNQLPSQREGSGLPLPTTDNSLNLRSLVSAASRAKSALHHSHCWSAPRSVAIDVLLDHAHRHASYSPPLHPSTYSRNSVPPFSHPQTLGSWVSAGWGKSCLSTTHSTERERKQQSWSRLLWRGGGRATVTTPTSFMQSRNWPDNLPDTEFIMKYSPDLAESCLKLQASQYLSPGTELGMASREGTCHMPGRKENRASKAASVAQDKRISYSTDNAQQRHFTERTHKHPEKLCGVSYLNTEDSVT